MDNIMTRLDKSGKDAGELLLNQEELCYIVLTVLLNYDDIIISMMFPIFL